MANSCNVFLILQAYAYGRMVRNGDSGCGISDGSFQAGNTCGAVDKSEEASEEEAEPTKSNSKFYPSIGSAKSARSNLKSSTTHTDMMVDHHSKNMLEKGNIPLNNRPKVRNADGSISTVRSITIEEGGKHIVLPTVIGDKVVSDKDAIAHYQKNGKHLGKFGNASHADKFAEGLHKAQERDMNSRERLTAKQDKEPMAKPSAADRKARIVEKRKAVSEQATQTKESLRKSVAEKKEALAGEKSKIQPVKKSNVAERKEKILESRKAIQSQVARDREVKKQAYLARKRNQR